MFKKEVERLVLLEILKTSNDSQLGAPSFSQHEPKINRVRFMMDFRNLNIKLKRNPNTLPKINKILLK